MTLNLTYENKFFDYIDRPESATGCRYAILLFFLYTQIEKIGKFLFIECNLQ